MDPDKILKFLSENLTDWSRVTFLTLARPVSRFDLAAISHEQPNTFVGGVESEHELWLSPRLLGFAVLSAVLGITMNSLLPNRVPAPQLFAAAAIVLGYWFLYGSLLHFLLLGTPRLRPLSRNPER